MMDKLDTLITLVFGYGTLIIATIGGYALWFSNDAKNGMDDVGMILAISGTIFFILTFSGSSQSE